jgi:uncharacterized SAM-binding protein YcdF (DUF218 family)
LYVYLSKLLPLLVLPVGLVFVLGLLALVLLILGRSKTSIAFLVAALAILWITSLPIVASTLLVTSAAHMPRSVGAFEQVGVEVFPVSTDVRVVHASAVTVFDLGRWR